MLGRSRHDSRNADLVAGKEMQQDARTDCDGRI
jgi:hypothetical protein